MDEYKYTAGGKLKEYAAPYNNTCYKVLAGVGFGSLVAAAAVEPSFVSVLAIGFAGTVTLHCAFELCAGKITYANSVSSELSNPDAKKPFVQAVLGAD